jgi:hypothetical protein
MLSFQRDIEIFMLNGICSFWWNNPIDLCSKLSPHNSLSNSAGSSSQRMAYIRIVALFDALTYPGMSGLASTLNITQQKDVILAVSDATLHRIVPVAIVESFVFGMVHRSF